jgi:hypothetical protein
LKPIAPKLTLILGDHPRFLYQLGAGARSEPNGADLERGTSPSPWITGGPGSAEVPKGSGLCLEHGSLRESGCTSYEKAGPRPRRGAIAGHDPLSVALYGRRTGILFDGDNLVSRASVCT